MAQCADALKMWSVNIKIGKPLISSNKSTKMLTLNLYACSAIKAQLFLTDH